MSSRLISSPSPAHDMRISSSVVFPLENGSKKKGGNGEEASSSIEKGGNAVEVEAVVVKLLRSMLMLSSGRRKLLVVSWSVRSMLERSEEAEVEDGINGDCSEAKGDAKFVEDAVDSVEGDEAEEE